MKRFLIFVCLAVVALLAVLYFLRSRPEPPGVGPLPELVSLAPPDATSLIYVDVAALRDSPFFSRLLSLLPEASHDPEYLEFVNATGFDYSRDLHRLLVALRPPRAPHSTTLAIAEGLFDRRKIVRYALAHGVLKHAGGREIFFSSRDSRPAALSFLSENRLLLAETRDAGAAEYLASLAGSRAASGPDAAFRERLARVSGAAVFAVGRIDPQRKKSPSRSAPNSDWASGRIGEVFDNVNWYSLAARPDGQTLKVSLEGECSDTWKARQLALLLESLRVVGRAALKDPQTRRQLPPQYLAALEQIAANGEVARQEERVQFRFELTAAMLR